MDRNWANNMIIFHLFVLTATFAAGIARRKFLDVFPLAIGTRVATKCCVKRPPGFKASILNAARGATLF